MYRIRNLCYNVYVNKRRGDDILETLQEKLNRLVNESVKELKEIGLGDNLNTNMTFKINYRAKQRLGQCCNKCDINISSWLLEVGSDKDIKNTIIHEILHTFKDTIGHKAKWQYYARYVNNRTEYNITRTTSINSIYARANIQRPTKHIHYKWEITCTKCGAVWKKQKMTTKVLNGFTEGNRIHKKCGGTDFRIVDLDNCEVIW